MGLARRYIVDSQTPRKSQDSRSDGGRSDATSNSLPKKKKRTRTFIAAIVKITYNTYNARLAEILLRT